MWATQYLKNTGLCYSTTGAHGKTLLRQNYKYLYRCRQPHLPDDNRGFVMLTNVFIIDEHVHHFDQPRLVVIHDEPRFVILIFQSLSKL
jgi:hypothetical protein